MCEGINNKKIFIIIFSPIIIRGAIELFILFYNHLLL